MDIGSNDIITNNGGPNATADANAANGSKATCTINGINPNAATAGFAVAAKIREGSNATAEVVVGLACDDDIKTTSHLPDIQKARYNDTVANAAASNTPASKEGSNAAAAASSTPASKEGSNAAADANAAIRDITSTPITSTSKSATARGSTKAAVASTTHLKRNNKSAKAASAPTTHLSSNNNKFRANKGIEITNSSSDINNSSSDINKIRNNKDGINNNTTAEAYGINNNTTAETNAAMVGRLARGNGT